MKLCFRPGRSLMMSVAILKSQGSLHLLCSGAIQRRMKSAPVISRASPAVVRRWILVVAIESFALSASTSL